MLFVDDNRENLRLGINSLEEKYDVITSPSAEKMYKLLESNNPDLILMSDRLRSILDDNPDQLIKWSDRVAFISEPYDTSTIVACAETYFKGECYDDHA